MAALLAVIAVIQIRPASGAPGDIFAIPAPAINADPPKATDIKDGDASVSTQTGALQYSYPIQVPPGRNGVAPQLALSYSSQGPTYGGIAAGWSLSIPIITEDHSQGRLRTRSSLIEAKQASIGEDPKKDDRFQSSMAGGRPLVAIAEPTGVASDVYMAYRAQNDTSFTRYERMVTGAAYRWRARTTDGNVWKFGEASNMPGCFVSDQYAPLTSMVDPFGNEVRYVYMPTAAVPGECKLLAIMWGQNLDAGLSDFARVVFSYDTEHVCNGVYSNSQVDYRSGVRIVTGASRLRAITVTAHLPGNPSSVVHTRQINLAYDESAESCNQPHAPVRLLTSIQESAWGTDSPRVDLPPVIFEYNSPRVTLVSPSGGYVESPWPQNEGVGVQSLGWGLRRLDDRWPTVESMFLDINGDGLQDVVHNAASSQNGTSISECSAEWWQNDGPDPSGRVKFSYGGTIALPRLKWRGSASPHPPGGAAQADPQTNKEGCALNGQVTAFMNSYPLANTCHHEPQSLCIAGSDASDSTRYCNPGMTRCPTDPGLPKPPTTLFRTYLAYRWLDMDSDGLVDLVAAVHGDIDSYDIERGNQPPNLSNPNDYRAGEPSMYGIPGLNQWPSCPAQGDRCRRFNECLDRAGARVCTSSGCTTNWNTVLTCLATTPSTGCANVLMKQASSPDGMPSAGIGVQRHPYERCEGRHPWFIYRNLGGGEFASTPTIKYQPVPLESTSGDSALGTGGTGISSENHAITDFDGDGWLDAVVRGTNLIATTTSCTTNANCPAGHWCDPISNVCTRATGTFAWQVWLGDGTGGFGTQMYVFPSRSMQPCPADTLGCLFGGNALSGTAGTWGQSTVSMAGLADINGDGAQDHWLGHVSTKNANIAFNYGDEIRLVQGSPPTGELFTPAGAVGDWIKPGNDTRVCMPDPNDPQICQPVHPFMQIMSGRTTAATRTVDVDHDGRMDVVTFASETAVPKVHFNLGGQFAGFGVNYGSGGPTNVDYEGARRRTEVVDYNSNTDDDKRWRLKSDLIDLDGDGIAEGVHFDEALGFRHAKPESTQPPRLLRAVHNGRGAHWTIAYAQMHEDLTVIQSPNELWFDGRPKASPRSQWVVKTISVLDDFAGTNATTQYFYKNPRYGADDSGRYSFRGFEEVTTVKPGPTGAANGARTIQRYGYDVDWSGRLVATVVMPSVAEGANEARTIDTTTWQELTLFGGAIKTYHAATAEHFVCANGQAEITCKLTPAGYTRTTTSYTAYPDTPTPGDEQLWLESATLLQAGQAVGNGDRETLTKHFVKSAASQYIVRPYETERKHRVSGAMVTFAKSRKEWDSNNGLQLTDEVWIDGNDANRSITRYDYDPNTGNRTKVWKPKQWAANPDVLTNLKRTTFYYDSRKLFVATETNELGHMRDYAYEYGTGTRIETHGPNVRSCTTQCPPSDPQYPVKELDKIRVDGLGRTIERWDSFSDDGSVFRLVQVGSTQYEDTATPTAPTSVTTRTLLDESASPPVWKQETSELDGHGRPIRATVLTQGSAPVDQVTTYAYRADGTLMTVSVPDPTANDGRTVTYTYGFDSLGRPTWLRRPDHPTPAQQSGVNIIYDGLTQTTTEVVGAAGGQIAETKTIKDSFGRLIEVHERTAISPLTWAVTRYDYDPDDNVRKIVDPEGVTTELVHDFAGHRREIIRHGRTWKYTYDKNGNLETEQAPGSPGAVSDLLWTTSIVYDDLDRPTSKSIGPRDMPPEDQELFALGVETFLWDSGPNRTGHLRQWKAYNQHTPSQYLLVDYSNDSQGNRWRRQHYLSVAGFPTLTRSTYTYFNVFGAPRLNRYLDNVNGSNETNAEFHYDARGLPARIRLNRTGEPSVTLAEQTRNVAGLVTARTSPLTPSSFIESRWTYDQLGRVKQQLVQKQAGPVQVVRQDLEYFGNDDPKSLTHYVGSALRKLDFSYDGRHQLTSVVGTPSGYFNANYYYGRAGRFTRASESQLITPVPLGSDVKPRHVNYNYSDPDPERLTSLTKVSDGSVYASYVYDAAGNITTRCYGGAATSSCPGEATEFDYDGQDQLRRATKKLNGVVQGREEYWYDHDGSRIAVVKRDAAGNKTELIWFIGDVQAHYNGDGDITHVYSHLSLGTPVARVDRTSNTTTALEYQFHGLANNTIAAVAHNGTVNASFSYAPFGEIIEATDDGGPDAGIAAHRRRMNDKFVDDISGLAYYGFRYYDKTSMTWTQSDPLYRFAPDFDTTAPRKANLYTFNLSNPLRYIDPDGREPGTNGILSEHLAFTGEPMADAEFERFVLKQTEVMVDVAVDAVAGTAADMYYAIEAAADGNLKGVMVGMVAAVIPGLGARTAGNIVEAGVEAAVKQGRQEVAEQGAKAGAEASAKASTLQPGPFAKDGVPARGPGRDFTRAERDAVNAEGVCHTCGSPDPKTKSGDFVPDHQPPNGIAKPGEPQRLYPHCLDCARKQGGDVNAEKTRKKE